MSWWKSVVSKFQRGQPAAAVAAAVAAKAVWREPSETPFGVRVLDLLAVTKGLLAVSSDPACAARAVSWGTSVGDELDVTAVATRPAAAAELRYPAAAILPDGLVFTPQAMEDKWVLAVRGDQLIAARSWTGEVHAVAHLRRGGADVVVTELRQRDEQAFAAIGDPVQVFDWLIRSHALGQRLPLPVSQDGAAALEATPLLAFTLFGHRAACAAIGWSPPRPPRPLRSEGRVIQAARAGDESLVRELAGRGEALDAPAATLGMTALLVAVIQGNLAMVRLLLELGARVDLGDDGGNVPLGRALVHGGSLELLEVLVGAGATVGVVNADGFGLLHAAAECGRADVVPWLVARGLDLEARTGRDHTPLHIACGLGKLDAARALLAAGASSKAIGPGGTPREIALVEGHADVAALFG